MPCHTAGSLSKKSSRQVALYFHIPVRGKGRFMKLKRNLAFFSVIAAVIALLSVESLAYYTVSQTVTNVITTGGVSVAVHETRLDGSEFPSAGVDILPGDTVSKIVRFENTGSAPLYLRVKLSKGMKNSTLSADNCMLINLNDSKWTYKDGYYYYNNTLSPGKTTEPMFTEVHFDGNAIGNEYLGKIFTLDITVYAVQSQHNGATVWAAKGWPNN